MKLYKLSLKLLKKRLSIDLSLPDSMYFVNQVTLFRHPVPMCQIIAFLVLFSCKYIHLNQNQSLIHNNYHIENVQRNH